MSEPERELVSAIVSRLPSRAARPLTDQMAHAVVRTDGGSTVLELAVPEDLPAAPVADGPLPVRALVASDVGEIIVWITDGKLSGVEFAWFTDEPPTRWPSPAELVFG